MGVSEDFVSREKRAYRFRLGTMLASSLSGFIAGALVASMVWLLAITVGKV